MATHSSILAWKSLRTEQPGRLQTMGPQESRTQLSDRANTDADSTPDPALIGLQSRGTLASRLEISVRKEKDFTASDHHCATSLLLYC